jgi:sugar phosphate isomerase/epimerase
MEKSIWTSYFRELGPEDAVSLLARNGWTRLELSCEHAAALLLRGDPARAAEGFLRFCADLGVGIPQAHFKLDADIALPYGPRRRAEMDELKRWVDLFAALRIEAGVVHPGGRSTLEAAPIASELLDLNLEGLTELLQHRTDAVTRICLENGPGAGELVRLIEATDAERLGICFDTGHLAVIRTRWPAHAQSEYDFVLGARKYLKALHLHDNDGAGDQHMLPFEGGAVDWGGLCAGLREIGYSGTLNFETPGEANCSLAERVAKLDSATRIAERLFAAIGRS